MPVLQKRGVANASREARLVRTQLFFMDTPYSCIHIRISKAARQNPEQKARHFIDRAHETYRTPKVGSGLSCSSVAVAMNC